MADIEQEFPIAAPPQRVYQGVSTPAGLDAWWTHDAAGVATPPCRCGGRVLYSVRYIGSTLWRS
jgi:uncharacterized protein YndB with AHSA1/START domain